VKAPQVKLKYTLEYAKIYINFLLAVLWKCVFKEKDLQNEKHYRDSSIKVMLLREKLDLIKKKSHPTVQRILQLLTFRDLASFLGYTDSGEFENTQLLYRFITSKVKQIPNFDVNIVPSRYENPNVQMLKELCTTNPDIIINLLEEAQFWDLDITIKRWFFSNYFVVEELLHLCLQHNSLHLVTNITSNPLMYTLIRDYPLFLQLYKVVSDKKLKDMFNTKDETGNNPFHKLMLTKYEENISEELIDIFLSVGADPLKVNAEKKYPLSLTNEQAMKQAFAKIRAAISGIEDILKDRRNRIRGVPN